MPTLTDLAATLEAALADLRAGTGDPLALIEDVAAALGAHPAADFDPDPASGMSLALAAAEPTAGALADTLRRVADRLEDGYTSGGGRAADGAYRYQTGGQA